MMLDELPMDAWPAITRFLIGVDLFDLARVNQWGWELFSQDVYWRERLSSDDGICDEENDCEEQGTVSALQRYVRAYSFRFQGLCKDDVADAVESSGRGSCAQMAAFYAVFVRQPTPITFDTWFCLLDGAEGGDSTKKNSVHNGGIIFGVQSAAHANYQWASYHQQLVIVSSDRTLYCSVVDVRPAIASNLEFNRWYHLALTYGNGVQRVYLDGQLVSTLMADLHHEWSRLSYAQVGTGCITAGEMNFPEPQSCGWYPFNGIIDQFRMWKREMSGEDIQALAQGRSESLLRGFQFSLRTPQLAYPPDNIVNRVRCSRPKEQRVEINRGKQPRPGHLSRSMGRAFTNLNFW